MIEIATSKSRFTAAVVGLGNIGIGYDVPRWDSSNVLTHAKAFMIHKKFSLVCGVDQDPVKRSVFKTFTGKPAFTSCEYLSESQIDVLAVCVPTVCHHEVIREALKYCRPKLIICEKPVAYTRTDYREILRLGRNINCTIAVNYIRRWDPGFIKVRNLVQSGGLGKIRAVHCYYTKGLLHNGSHFIDLMHFWFGNEIGCQLIGSEYTCSDHDINVSFALIYNGFNVVFQSAEDKDYSLYETDIIGSEGRIRSDISQQGFEYFKKESDPLYKHYNALCSSHHERILCGMKRYQYNVANGIYRYLRSTEELPSDIVTAGRTLETCWEVLKLCRD